MNGSVVEVDWKSWIMTNINNGIHSIIQQETEGQRTEMCVSSDVVVKSEPSMAPNDNFNTVARIPDNRMKLSRGVSPAVSMKSDWSMDHPYNFKRVRTTSDSGVRESTVPSSLSMKSDTSSMGQPINFREYLKEFSSSPLTSVYVRCSLCSSFLKNPVSIHCGHSYCEHCITIYWSQPGPTGDYVCPQCKKGFPTRPVLSVNVALNWTLQALQKTSFSPACPTLPHAGPGDVACDICSSLKLRAVKTCVTCDASYCENHVRQHYTVPALQKHTLVQVNEDTRLSQWVEDAGRMEGIKEESFVANESEEHQEVASMDDENEYVMQYISKLD